jgi:hypothetical protein
MAAGSGGGTARQRVKAVPDKPDLPRTTFNMDAAEREDGQAQPFIVALGGVRYQLGDALNVSADNLAAAGSQNIEFLRLIAPKDAADEFMAAIGAQPMWKVRDLVTAYFTHYGVPAAPESAA